MTAKTLFDQRSDGFIPVPVIDLKASEVYISFILMRRGTGTKVPQVCSKYRATETISQSP
jgi:hypothetical protein